MPHELLVDSQSTPPRPPTFRMQVDMLELDSHGWKSALHGFKGDIFNLFEEAQEEIKRHEEKASIAEKRIVDLDPGLQAGKVMKTHRPSSFAWIDLA